MEIDVDKIIIPHNWVLIKPDMNFDTFQVKGRETGIHVAPWGVNQASHISVTGTVYKVPQRLVYNGYEVKKRRRALSNIESEPDLELPIIRSQSMAYDVNMELRPGDIVYYEYTTRLSAMKEGRILDTTEGEMMLVPYDLLILTFPYGTNRESIQPNNVRMLNGYLLIKPLEYALEKTLQGVRGVRTEMDLFRPVKEDEKYVKFNDIQFANVILCGSQVRDYIDFDKAPVDDMVIGRTGQKIAYDARMQKRLEVEHHHIVFKQYILYRIHRKDILIWYVNGKINFFKNL